MEQMGELTDKTVISRHLQPLFLRYDVVLQIQNVIRALAVKVAGRGEGRELLGTLLRVILFRFLLPPLLRFLLRLGFGFGVGDTEWALGLVFLDLGARAFARGRRHGAGPGSQPGPGSGIRAKLMNGLWRYRVIRLRTIGTLMNAF